MFAVRTDSLCTFSLGSGAAERPLKHSTWTDAELLNHDFEVSGRPDTDPNLSRAKPHAVAAFRFTRDYNITPPQGIPNRLKVQPYVWCALCQEATHWKGWQAEYVDASGQTVTCLIGQDCARRKGGDVVKVAANAYRATKDRAYALRSIAAMTPLLAPTLRALEDWGASKGVSAVAEWRAQIRSMSEDFANEVHKSAGVSPPILLLEREVRDHAAEAARAAKRGKGADLPPIYRIEYKRVGQIHGRALYSAPLPSIRIRRMIEDLQQVANYLRQPTDGVATKLLLGVIAQVRRVVDAARELEDAYTTYMKGLEVPAIDEVVAWYNKLPKTKHDAVMVGRSGSMLIVNRAWGATTTARIPDAEPIRRPEILDALEKALLGHGADS